MSTAAIFTAYAYGTAFWYALRGGCRVWDPLMVAGWFRPPAQATQSPTDLELYNIHTDGWCLITLALILVSAVPSLSPSSSTLSSASSAPYAYARWLVAATVFHHVATGYGAWQHYKLDTHYNTSMGIGVWGNVWLAATGAVTLGCLCLVGGGGVGERKMK
ncbi:hypothetical protein C7974DRAFT_352854 [Boeremia exigua]|uniref:uncharacterized protein n=1 Tax=Boeremia exigua TaxID=749465 RepID=UPI001E8CD784|nr:uncharacterized protein C7974DRAFT_352854 [Boeremia exigua]KAH6638839.1 hypothetical protein C7974DRAFT_352854 [Boeremia exigua]